MRSNVHFFLLAIFLVDCGNVAQESDMTVEAGTTPDVGADAHDGGTPSDDRSAPVDNDAEVESGTGAVDGGAPCMLTGDGQCKSADNGHQCMAWTASPYDTTRECTMSAGVTVACCTQGALDCGAAAVLTCLQRAAADGGLDLFSARGKPQQLLADFTECARGDQYQAVASAAPCD